MVSRANFFLGLFEITMLNSLLMIKLIIVLWLFPFKVYTVCRS